MFAASRVLRSALLMATFPEWWTWDLSFTAHAEMRMEQRGVTEVDLRAMLERATGFEPNVVDGRFMIDVRHQQRPWLVIVEPDIGREATRRRDRLRGVRMTERSLQVTYRKGRPFAACLASVARHRREEHADRSPRPTAYSSLTITALANRSASRSPRPQAVSLERLNRLLAELGETPLTEHEYQPVQAA